MNSQFDNTTVLKNIPETVSNYGIGITIVRIYPPDIKNLLSHNYFNFKSTGKRTYITFMYCEISPTILNSIQKLCDKVFKAYSLTFDYCSMIEFEDINSLFEYFKEIECLRLSNIRPIFFGDEMLRDFSKLTLTNTSIKSITLDISEMNLLNIRDFVNFKSLKEISLTSSSMTLSSNTKDLDNNLIPTIKNFKSSPISLDVLSKFPSVETLNLIGSFSNYESIAPNLRYLKKLQIQSANNVKLENMKELSELKSLDLYHSSVCLKGIENLNKLNTFRLKTSTINDSYFSNSFIKEIPITKRDLLKVYPSLGKLKKIYLYEVLFSPELNILKDKIDIS